MADHQHLDSLIGDQVKRAQDRRIDPAVIVAKGAAADPRQQQATCTAVLRVQVSGTQRRFISGLEDEAGEGAQSAAPNRAEATGRAAQ